MLIKGMGIKQVVSEAVFILVDHTLVLRFVKFARSHACYIIGSVLLEVFLANISVDCGKSLHLSFI